MEKELEVFEQSYLEALKCNQNSRDRILEYRNALIDVRLNLEIHHKELYQNIMVPIGKKALLKGKLIHTNEVLISLGDKWLVKKSATNALDVCNRLIQRCDNNLAEFEKEADLLNSNLRLPFECGTFSDENVQEIMEPYDEEEEKRWREKHRERVRSYKKQQASDDSKLFERLDHLEKEESECYVYDDDDNDAEVGSSDFVEQRHLNDTTLSNGDESHDLSSEDKVIYNGTTKRVSFAERIDLPDANVIRFRHSDSAPATPTTSNDIVNPSDIYREFTRRGPHLKSILKASRSEPKIAPSVERFSDWTHMDAVLNDIVEITPNSDLKVDGESRPMSKFKKSRIQQRN